MRGRGGGSDEGVLPSGDLALYIGIIATYIGIAAAANDGSTWNKDWNVTQQVGALRESQTVRRVAKWKFEQVMIVSKG